MCVVGYVTDCSYEGGADGAEDAEIISAVAYGGGELVIFCVDW